MLDRKNLTLSLYHLSPSTRYLLKERSEHLDLVVYPKLEFGYFIIVDLENTNLTTTPPDLIYLLRFAHMNDCYYLELDREYPVEDSVLFTYYPPTIEEEVIYHKES